MVVPKRCVEGNTRGVVFLFHVQVHLLKGLKEGEDPVEWLINQRMHRDFDVIVTADLHTEDEVRPWLLCRVTSCIGQSPACHNKGP